MNDKDKLARQKLIDAASQLFAEKGIDGTTTRDIAQAAGLNISLISYYFQGKEGLYKEVIRDFAVAAQTQLDQLLAEPHISVLTKEIYLKTMRQIIEGTIQMKFNYPHISTLLQREVLSGLPHSKEIYENTFKHLGLKITSILESAQKNNIVRKDINVHVLFLSMVHSMDMYFTVAKCPVSIMDKCFKIPEQTDEYIEQVFTVFIKGTLL